MPLINCPECHQTVSDQAPACPHCGAPIAPPVKPKSKNVSCLTGGCLVLVVLFLIGLIANSFDPSTPERAASIPEPVASAPEMPGQSSASDPAIAVRDTPKLALLSSTGYEAEYGGYHYVEGQVKNLSNEPLKSLTAVAIWMDKDGEFIKSDDSLVDYNPLLPGQTSPFKVISTGNPKMSKYRVEFKTLFGPAIDYEDQRKSRKRK